MKFKNVSLKKCIFCGNPLIKGNINFEHIISQWLVAEADLQSRTMQVPIGGNVASVAMNRIGGKACISCNSVRSNMETKAKTAYEKIRDGKILETSDVENLFDWMDKVRVGIWLWSLDTSMKKENIQPKFHLSDRIGTKDRILFINKYQAGPRMKGLELYGLNYPFFRSPSAFGMLINNIAIYSISTEFILRRHSTNIDLIRKIGKNRIDSYKIDGKTSNSLLEKVEILGDTQIFGQQILPRERDVDDPTTKGIWDHDKGSITKLDAKLTTIEEFTPTLIKITYNTRMSRCLNEINISRAMDFILRDYVLSDFSELNRYAADHEIKYFNMLIELETLHRNRMKSYFKQLTGIGLPR